jgi:hypothetical protein
MTSSHYFVTYNEDGIITGQMLRDINFSLLGDQNEKIKLSLCFGKPNYIENIINFDYVIDINRKIQNFEFNNQKLEITFYYSKHEQKYMIYCPSFILKS